MNEKQIWKPKNKLCPRSNDPPTALLDDKGNIITGGKVIEKLAAEVYKKRVEGSTIVENLAGLEKDTNKLCMNRLRLCKQKKSDTWDISDLKGVLKKLSSGKIKECKWLCKQDFDNNRGVFRITVLRSIIDWLMYNGTLFGKAEGVEW